MQAVSGFMCFRHAYGSATTLSYGTTTMLSHLRLSYVSVHHSVDSIYMPSNYCHVKIVCHSIVHMANKFVSLLLMMRPDNHVEFVSADEHHAVCNSTENEPETKRPEQLLVNVGCGTSEPIGEWSLQSLQS